MLRAAVTAPQRAPEAEPARRRGRFARDRPTARGPWYTRLNWWHIAPVAISVVLSIVYLIWQPRTVDLAAHTFRSRLFADHREALSDLEINPLIVLAEGQGVRAVDVRMVRRARQEPH